jgi:VanZ family protein
MIGDRDSYRAATRRLLLWSLASYAALVVCASLYPFSIDVAAGFAEFADGAQGLTTWRDPSRRDLIINIVAYLPIGFLLAGLLVPRWGIAAIPLATIGGATLSLAVELLQHFVAVRVPSLADWFWNAVSTLLGAALLLLLRALPLRPAVTRLRRLQVSPALGLLLVIWIAAHAAPFVPRVRVRRMYEALQPLLQLHVDLARLATHFASFLILSAVLRALVRRDSFWPLFTVFVIGSLAARIMFVGHQLEASELLGVALALPFIVTFRRRGHRDAQTPVFAVLCVALLVAGTAPWSFAIPASDFRWMPFGDVVGGTADGGYRNLLERVFVLFGAVWVGAATRFGLALSTACLLAIALLGEIAQLFLATRIADTTDFTLIVLAALLVHAVDVRARAG